MRPTDATVSLLSEIVASMTKVGLANRHIGELYYPDRLHGESPRDGNPDMKISARNQLKGTVLDVVKGATTSHVRINVGGATVTAFITSESVDDLKIANGLKVTAVVKSSDVMVAIED